MAAGARLYVYYRVALADAEHGLAAFRQARGEAAIELLRRPELRDGCMTWMEIYPTEFVFCEPRVAQAMAPWLQGGRNLERFEPLA